MKKLLHYAACALAVCATQSATAQEMTDVPGRRVVCEYTLGDALGEVSNISKMMEYLYGKDNLPLRSVLLASGTTSTFTPTDYYVYSCTATPEQLEVNTNSYQWKTQTYGITGYVESKSSAATDRVYDAKRNLIKNVTNTYIYTYEYDDNGFMTKQIVTNSYSGALSKTITYYNNEKGLPVTAIETNSKDAFSCKYVKDFDEDGKLITTKTYKRSNASDESTEYISTVEDYTYDDNGMLVEYLKSNGGTATKTPVPNSKTTYTVYEGNANKILKQTYTYNKTSGKWTTGATKTVTEYADLMEDPSGMIASDVKAELTAPDATEVKVSFTAPKEATAETRFIIFRSGFIAADVAYSEIYDASQNRCFFTDKNLTNGTWDYFVMAYQGTSLQNVTANTQHYISDIASVTVEKPLQAVQNLACTVSKATADGSTIYVLNITWDEIPGLEETTFEYNDVYMERPNTTPMLLSSSHITDPKVTSCSIDYQSSREEMLIYVISKYAEGIAESEHISIKKADLEKLATGIECIKDIEDLGNAVEYDAAGRIVNGTAGKTPSLRIVVVKNGNTTKTYKVMK